MQREHAFAGAELDNGRMSPSVSEYARSVENRIVGRVFTYDETLHFVLAVDEESGLVRLSCRYRDHTELRYMPIAEVCLRVAGIID